MPRLGSAQRVTDVSSTLSLKTVHRTVLPCGKNDFALFPWYARLRIPPLALFGYSKEEIPFGYLFFAMAEAVGFEPTSP